VLQVEILNDLWLLKNHPLYRLVAKDISSSYVPRMSSGTEKQILQIADEPRLRTYQQIQVPHSQANRYTVLLGDCKELINEAVTDTHFFKICRMAISDLIAKRGMEPQGNGGPRNC
jgi:hypothetical protein